MSNPENLVFPKKEDYPAVMPEVLTETQQAFTDFIMRYTTDASQQKVDCFDHREGVLAVSDPSQMVAVDRIELNIQTAIDTDDLSATPYRTRAVNFYSEIVGDIQSLYYDEQRGWAIITPDSNWYNISEQAAQPIVSVLLEGESDGKLSQI